jgi:SAM-dependent methyltransferase
MHVVPFSSAGFWEARYCAGGTSGAGSYGRLGTFKAAFINDFVALNEVGSVIDLGCGDGALLGLLEVPAYLGVDVSPTTLARCVARFADNPGCRFQSFDRLSDRDTAELGLSLDVIYHLVEDATYLAYLDRLFGLATRLAVIYASNIDGGWPARHVRHRRFTDTIAERFPEWRLAAHVPNLFPYDPARPDDTSFADFFVYARRSEPVVLSSPAE